MTNLTNDLKAVSKELKALVKKVEKTMKAVDKLQKTQAVVKTKTKAKTTRKATGKKAAEKKTTAMTATDKVVNIIQRAKEGIDVPTLAKKTGFEDKKIRNIVFRAFKQGKITKASRGLYVAT